MHCTVLFVSLFVQPVQPVPSVRLSACTLPTRPVRANKTLSRRHFMRTFALPIS